VLLRRRAPETVRALVQPGDRLVAWALTAEGEPVAATERALHLPGVAPIAWHDVEKATWSRPMLTIAVIADAEPAVAGTGPSHLVDLPDARQVPEAVRALVTGSVAWSSHNRLQPDGGVRVVGRRQPDRDAFAWRLVFDQGTDLADPRVRAQADQLLEAARRSIG
jgi:hypothetical protein